MTSSIARMNMFLHGIEDFKIVRGDTLSAPAFTDGDRLRQFDVSLANPPYSIKQWDRAAWSPDRFGRNFRGTQRARVTQPFQVEYRTNLADRTVALEAPDAFEHFRSRDRESRAEYIEGPAFDGQFVLDRVE